MIEIHDDATLAAAMATGLDDTCRALIERIVTDARALHLWEELTAIVVIENDDSAGQFEDVLGYPPATGPLGGQGAAILPYWVQREDHGDTLELLVPAGDGGFCWFLIMSRAWFDRQIAID